MAGGRGMSMSSEAATSAPRTPPLLDFRMGMSGSASFQKWSVCAEQERRSDVTDLAPPRISSGS
jgi:hypothetical protein